jgi:hypothetical protein
MSKKATPMAMCLSRHIDANNMLYSKVLLDPLGLSKKNTTPSPWATLLNTVVTIFFGKC